MKVGTLRTCVWWISVAVSVVAQLPAPADKTEKDQYARMAKAWSELGTAAADKGVRATAALALKEAEACGFAGADRDRLAAKVEALTDDAAAPPEVTKKEQEVRQRVASACDDLAKRKAAEPARAEPFVFEALRVLPGDKKRTTALQARVAAAATAKDRATAERLLLRVPEADPEGLKAGEYAATEGALAKEDVLLVRAPGHPQTAYVALPAAWTPNAKTPWPMVVAFEGAGSGFAGRAAELRKANAKRPYVVVCPVTFGNANELEASKYPHYDSALVKELTPMETRDRRLEIDFEGLAVLLPHLRARYGTEEKPFVTGYSGGGFHTYRWLRTKPDELRAACPVSANYGERGPFATPTDGGPPILLITGENDSAKERIFPQSEEAMAAFKEAGFKEVRRDHLKGRQHETFPDLCLDFFDQVRARKK
jgi:poly(3-hydroxybutyrate) depolymerase